MIVWTKLAIGRLVSKRRANLHSDSLRWDFSVTAGVVALLGPFAGLVASS